MALAGKYFGIAFAIALIIMLFNVFGHSGLIYSFKQGAGYTFWMTLGPGAGMTIGAYLRLWLMPDMIMTGGGMSDMMKARIFWLVGPQCGGWLLGLMVVGSHLH